MTETSNWIQQVIQVVAPCGTSSGTIKGCFLEFLFLFGSLITLLIGFGDFNLNLWDSPVAKVSKMGCNISVGGNSSDLLQLRIKK